MDDEVKEESLEFQEQEKLYNDVEDKIWKSLQLYADCEESYEVYKAGLPEPCLTKKEVEEDSMSAKVNKKELQAQLVSQPTKEAKNRWLDQLKVTNEASEAESEIDDARVKVTFDEGQKDVTVQDI